MRMKSKYKKFIALAILQKKFTKYILFARIIDYSLIKPPEFPGFNLNCFHRNLFSSNLHP